MLSEEKLNSDEDQLESRTAPREKTGSAVSDELDYLETELSEIRELSRIEKTLSLEVVDALKPLLKQLSRRFEIRPSVFPKLGEFVTRMVIMPDGEIILEFEGGTVKTRPLEDLPPESLVKILAEILPSILEIVSEQREILSERKDALEQVVSRLRRVNFDLK